MRCVMLIAMFFIVSCAVHAPPCAEIKSTSLTPNHQPQAASKLESRVKTAVTMQCGMEIPGVSPKHSPPKISEVTALVTTPRRRRIRVRGKKLQNLNIQHARNSSSSTEEKVHSPDRKLRRHRYRVTRLPQTQSAKRNLRHLKNKRAIDRIHSLNGPLGPHGHGPHGGNHNL